MQKQCMKPHTVHIWQHIETMEILLLHTVVGHENVNHEIEKQV